MKFTALCNKTELTANGENQAHLRKYASHDNCSLSGVNGCEDINETKTLDCSILLQSSVPLPFEVGKYYTITVENDG